MCGHVSLGPPRQGARLWLGRRGDLSYTIEHGASVSVHITLEPNANCHPLIQARYDTLVRKALGEG